MQARVCAHIRDRGLLLAAGGAGGGGEGGKGDGGKVVMLDGVLERFRPARFRRRCCLLCNRWGACG